MPVMNNSTPEDRLTSEYLREAVARFREHAIWSTGPHPGFIRMGQVWYNPKYFLEKYPVCDPENDPEGLHEWE